MCQQRVTLYGCVMCHCGLSFISHRRASHMSPQRPQRVRERTSAALLEQGVQGQRHHTNPTTRNIIQTTTRVTPTNQKPIFVDFKRILIRN